MSVYSAESRISFQSVYCNHQVKFHCDSGVREWRNPSTASVELSEGFQSHSTQENAQSLSAVTYAINCTGILTTHGVNSHRNIRGLDSTRDEIPPSPTSPLTQCCLQGFLKRHTELEVKSGRFVKCKSEDHEQTQM